MFPFFLLLAIAAPAGAQPSDPIGALLDHPEEEPDEPDEAAEKLAPLPPYQPTPRLPATALPYAPARPKLTAPVHLEETGKNPDAPPSADDLAYDTRLKSSAASAQEFQGPLDGGWTLAAQDAGDLYALQLVDRPDRLEGAWRDLRRKGALGASGVVDDIQRTGQDLTLRFSGEGDPAAVVTAVLHGTDDGRWSGELTEGGKRRSVVLRRQNP